MVDNDDDLLAEADAVANNDRHPTTVRNYRRIITRLRAFARDSNDWGEGIFDYPPLPDDFVKSFLAKMVQPREDNSVRTSSSIRSYISALKWWYSTLNVQVCVTT
jgi:hypothetical protein